MVDAWLHDADVITHDEQDVGFIIGQRCTCNHQAQDGDGTKRNIQKRAF
jgi:hypothetical protein